MCKRCDKCGARKGDKESICMVVLVIRCIYLDLISFRKERQWYRLTPGMPMVKISVRNNNSEKISVK